MLVARSWRDYELIDAGEGEKLERWGEHVLRRPDAQVIWPRSRDAATWDRADAIYHRSSSGGGRWETVRPLPPRWPVRYGKLAFNVELTGFKHTGIFPEQAVNWDWLTERIAGAKMVAGGAVLGHGDEQAVRPVRVLNLFAYTGGATLAAACAGAGEVVHVDAAKRIVGWAKANLTLSALDDRHVRFIVDDVAKFVRREIRRGRRYEVIVMDPPVYGRGPSGELWQIERSLAKLLESCLDLISDRPMLLLVNAYTSGISAQSMGNLLALSLGRRLGGAVSCGELGLPVSGTDLVLPAGVYGRWEAAV